ncbi:MAG: PilW family protein [Pseudomonadota bacterium]|nr:PilW family protein [Pseudomonadota bacterium]
MKTFTKSIARMDPKSPRGFTLIELMVAITVSIFLIGGLLMMVQSTRDAFGKQNLLAQLQDNERLVMTFVAEVVESAGYFPDPVHNTAAAIFPGTFNIPHGGSFGTAGQAVFGTSGGGVAPGDTVTIRYAAAPNDNVFNCLGTTNTTAANDVFVNTFWVNTADPNNPILTCTVSSAAIAATAVPLVNGVQNLTILYGVKRSIIDTGSCADTYLNAGQMAPVAFPLDWVNVCSINLQISFTNPLNPTGLPIIINRVIATMIAAGVNS